jgi:hypothetical protein
LFSGFLTLYVIPVMYSYISRNKKSKTKVESTEEISA